MERKASKANFGCLFSITIALIIFGRDTVIYPGNFGVAWMDSLAAFTLAALIVGMSDLD